MAITGTGTKDDPYIVHDYDELKEKYTEYNGSSMEWYIKLVNDIDCNVLGDDWEWTAMIRGYGNKYIDLAGHTIKNIMIRSGSSLFSDNDISTYISNGKILNVFNNGAANILDGVNLRNISISMNATNTTDFVIRQSILNNCAVYIKSSKLNNSCIKFAAQSTNRNNDYYFDIADANSQYLLDYFGFDDVVQDSCRIRGIIKGNIGSGFIYGYPGLNNCVVEVDNSGAMWSSGTPQSPIANGTGIFNVEIGNYPSSISNMMLCTTAQMRDPDYLNSIGFNVVKVGG